jgi:dipeptidyl aminopeptidase/acylaminoacyl peptidase
MASNYRAADEFGGAEINDVLKLIDICPTLAKADTSRIGMFGWSRGGMMTYLAMARTTKLRTAVVGNGPTDLRTTLIERPGLEETVFSQCIPDYWANKEEALSQRSVVDWPEQLCPNTSLLILCGTQDRQVDHAQAERIDCKLTSMKHPHELKSFDTDHFFSDHKEQLHAESIAWFQRELKATKDR